MKVLRTVATLVAATITVAACGSTASDADGPAEVRNLEIMVGNSPGGGYDTMARQIAEVLERDEIATGTRVMNKPGAGGSVALQQLVNQAGDEDVLMTTGVAVTGAVITNESPVSMADVTPIAKVLEEPMIIAVDATSPYESIDDLVDAWKADPEGFTAGGGAIGGPDYQQVMQLADTVGIDPRDVNFVSYDGGGELLPAILGGKVEFTASGYAEWADQIDSGEIRVLAVSGAERLEALDAPTLKEEGIDLEFVNWRGLVAPPDISEERQEQLIDALEQLHESSAWQGRLEQNGQIDGFLTGEEFGDFMTDEHGAIDDLLTKAGLL